MSREIILATIKANQPSTVALPEDKLLSQSFDDLEKKFIDTLTGIGGIVVNVKTLQDVEDYLSRNFTTKRMVSLVHGVGTVTTTLDEDPHLLENVELAVVAGHFGVAENGAIWITDKNMGDRALPFIAQHLAMIIHAKQIVPTLHEAYERIGGDDYQYGSFIAGPSKTADIEQSLVLGAHGPKSNTIFLLNN